MTTLSNEDSISQDETSTALGHAIAVGKTSAPHGSDHAKESDIQEEDETQSAPSDGAEEPKAVEEQEKLVEGGVPEHVSPGGSHMNGNAVEHEEEALTGSPPVHEPASLSLDLGTGHDGISDQKLGAKNPGSEDSIRIPENFGQKTYVIDVEGRNFNHILPVFTQLPASLTDVGNSPDTSLLFESKDTEKRNSAAEVVGEPAQGPSTNTTVPPTMAKAGIPVLQNLKAPDMSWASDRPVAFTSSAPKSSAMDQKVGELGDGAEAALLRRYILRQHAARQGQQVEKEEEAAFTRAPPTPPAQEKKGTQVSPKSGKISNRKKQRETAKAKRQVLLDASVTAVATPNPPASKSAAPATALMEDQHTAEEQHSSIDGEFKIEAKPSKRSQRAKAYAESKEKKARELKASQELKKVQEEEAAAERATAPVLTAAAKRRNRQKRNNAGKSYADALKI